MGIGGLTDASGIAKPVCGRGDACVECVSDSDCTADPAKPVCDPATNACTRCSTDAQCAAKLGADPGVCMSHQDGRCATVTEAIFLQDTARCATAAGDNIGSPDLPFCSVRPALVALSSDRRLIIIRGTVQATNYVVQPVAGSAQITFVGQQSGAIAGGAFSALAIDGAAVFARDLTFKLSSAPAVIAKNAGVLSLQHVIVDNNPGGGVLVDGAGFEIRNTSITRNGPATTGPTTWGGMLVQNLSALTLRAIDLVTIQNNGGPGLSCSDRIDGTRLLASDNAASNIGITCQVTPCSPAGPACGAQP